MAVTLTTVTGLVLVFSALGIFGLATFNVNTRTRQIGTRRAVGARRRDIVRYFMTENWLVTTLGVVVGCGLALGAGSGCPPSTSMPRLDLYYLVGGVLGPVGGGPVRRLAALLARRQGVAGHGDAQHLKHRYEYVRRLQPQADPERLRHDFSDFERRGSPGPPDCTWLRTIARPCARPSRSCCPCTARECSALHLPPKHSRPCVPRKSTWSSRT